MALHIIKLVVGIDDLDEFLAFQRQNIVDYDGISANVVRTRFKPKQADEILETGGSLYRVIKNRIQCRQKILGFEQAESRDRGTQCLIMVEPVIIQTISKPKRPFQGWRYFKAADIPRDRGIYLGEGQREEIEPEMEEELRGAGLL